ncbi:predicted protein [Naegleria gruberi]|uniref:Predicted protein n=1 Tax=Naegleria gruberi TaxID=5762 RepID=D2VR67_NAEGR|nr:uncharacterized protein NAEGRDRAFT_71478 [Naegleria gruberi]EFC40619.1 predicted protein [Naegleria gruberi]|eukprot:XP_002673363.1 predicted protein [Naegleria gruberi strain NEG-M]
MKRVGEGESQQDLKKVKLEETDRKLVSKYEEAEIEKLINWNEQLLENIKNKKQEIKIHSDLFDQLINDISIMTAKHPFTRFYIFYLNRQEDLDNAWEWCVKSMENNHLNAILKIGSLYSSDSDYKNSMKWYSKAAELNSAESQYCIGNLFAKGKGVKKDYSKALEWYMKAAQQDHPASLCAIGNFYMKVNYDTAKAVEYYSKAAELNCVNALIEFLKLSMIFSQKKRN